MRASAVHELLDRTGASWGVIEDLVADGDLIAAPYRDEMFYVQRFDSRRSRPAEHS